MSNKKEFGRIDPDVLNAVAHGSVDTLSHISGCSNISAAAAIICQISVGIRGWVSKESISEYLKEVAKSLDVDEEGSQEELEASQARVREKLRKMCDEYDEFVMLVKEQEQAEKEKKH